MIIRSPVWRGKLRTFLQVKKQNKKTILSNTSFKISKILWGTLQIHISRESSAIDWKKKKDHTRRVVRISMTGRHRIFAITQFFF